MDGVRRWAFLTWVGFSACMILGCGGGDSGGGVGGGAPAQNPPPIANNDEAITDEDAPVIIKVLANDTDPDPNGSINPTSVQIVTPPLHGTVSINRTSGEVTYTPSLNYFGADSFQYNIRDNNGMSATAPAEVRITVHPKNDPPKAVDDTAATQIGVPVGIDLLANDTDPDSSLAPASVKLINNPSRGTVRIDPGNGKITYTPTGELCGVDTFTYSVEDADKDTSNPGKVTVSVNCPPTARNDSETTPEDTPVTINILANDTGGDDGLDSKSVQITGTAANGTISVNPNSGAVTYTPKENYFGPDSFRYKVKDKAGALSVEATVAITVTSVNDRPTANDDTAATQTGLAVLVDVLANDTDPDSSLDPTTVKVASAPARGTTGVNPASGKVTYTPTAGNCGVDTFFYTVADISTLGSATSNQGKVTVAVNCAPEAKDDAVQTLEDTSVAINVLANDRDSEGTLDRTSVAIETPPTNGTVSVNPNSGILTYTPKPNYFGPDSIGYTVKDNQGAVSKKATVTLTVISVNDPPLANDDTAETDVNRPVAIPVIANDTDPDSLLDPTSVTVTTPPGHGRVSVDLTRGTVTYTPVLDFFGTDFFKYTVKDDGNLKSVEAVVTVSVTAKNLGPSVVSVDGRQLLLRRRNPDGTLAAAAPYIIRGVVWSPASRDTNTSPSDPNNTKIRRLEFGKWMDQDIPLLAGMKVNTVRINMDPGFEPELRATGMALLDKLYNEKIMVIMTVDDAINNVSRVQQAVDFYKNHPAILFFNLGSEWNLNRYFGVASSALEAAQLTEEAASLLKALDKNHPVATSYGDIDIDADGLRLADTAHYVKTVAPSVDVWGLNVYRGKTFGTLFDQWASTTPKPMYVAEFGTDAFAATTLTASPLGFVDEGMQASWDLSLWDDLFRNLSANDRSKVALGGTVFGFNDEWWKAGTPASQETGGVVLLNGHPDGFANEEYFGIVRIDRTKRSVYDFLRTAFDPAYQPSAVTWDFTNLSERIRTNLPDFWVAGRAGAGNLVTVNRIAVPTTAVGDFSTEIPLVAGPNVIELRIESSRGVRSTFTKIVEYDPVLSTAQKRLLYIDTTSPDGTLVIDLDRNVVLGLLKRAHVRGISPSGKEIYMQDRSVISTGTHRELGAPLSPLSFSDLLLTDRFLVSPDGIHLYSRNEILDVRTNTLLPQRLPIDIITGSSFGGFRAGGPAISADGKWIFAQENPTYMINTENNTATPTPIFSGSSSTRFVSDLALSPDGMRLYRSAYNFAQGWLQVFDSGTYALLGTIGPIGDFTGEVVFSRDGQKVIIGTAGNPALGGGGITVVDTATLKAVSGTPLSNADNLVISDLDEFFVSSGTSLGVDIFTLQANGTLIRSKSFFLNVNYTRDHVGKVIFKP